MRVRGRKRSSGSHVSRRAKTGRAPLLPTRKEVTLVGKSFHVFTPACPRNVPKSGDSCVECRAVQWSSCERMQGVLLDTIPRSCIHVTHAQHHSLDREMVPFAE